MINSVFSFKVLGEEGVTRDRAVKGGSSTFPNLNSGRGKDATLSHKLTSILGELN